MMVLITKKAVTVDQFGFGVLRFASDFISGDSGRSLVMPFENYDASKGWSNYLQSVGVPVPMLKLYHRLYTHCVLQTAFTQFSPSQRRTMTQGAMDGIQDRPADYDFNKTFSLLETAYDGSVKFSPAVQSLTNPEARLTFLPNPNAGVLAAKVLVDIFVIPKMKDGKAFNDDFKDYSSTMSATIGTTRRAIDDCQSALDWDPLLEWAPPGGRVGFQQLTGLPGFQRMKAHGKASNPQRRVQTAGVTGVSERRDAARALEAAQCLP
jgi:hypothetical protein